MQTPPAGWAPFTAGPAATPYVIDVDRADPARRYDYWLGGKTNFAADRASADAIAERLPSIRAAAVENRLFLRRVVPFLAREGIRQFLDIGTGLPTSPNVHELAQDVAPDARVVYVDNGPVVISHARALMTSSPAGATAFIHADLRDPDAILSHPELRSTLDLDQPVALLLVAVLHFLDDADDAYAVVARLLDALPRGSYLVLTHATYDGLASDTVQQLTALSAQPVHGSFRPRTRREVARFLTGLQIVQPGLVSVVGWRPEQYPQPVATQAQTGVYGVVARLP